MPPIAIALEAIKLLTTYGPDALADAKRLWGIVKDSGHPYSDADRVFMESLDVTSAQDLAKAGGAPATPTAPV